MENLSIKAMGGHPAVSCNCECPEVKTEYVETIVDSPELELQKLQERIKRQIARFGDFSEEIKAHLKQTYVKEEVETIDDCHRILSALYDYMPKYRFGKSNEEPITLKLFSESLKRKHQEILTIKEDQKYFASRLKDSKKDLAFMKSLKMKMIEKVKESKQA